MHRECSGRIVANPEPIRKLQNGYQCPGGQRSIQNPEDRADSRLDTRILLYASTDGRQRQNPLAGRSRMGLGAAAIRSVLKTAIFDRFNLVLISPSQAAIAGVVV